MFSLAFPIDNTVKINGEEFTIDLAFDNVLRLFELIANDEIDDLTKIETGLEMLIGVNLECDPEKKRDILMSLFEKCISKGSENSQAVDIKGNPMPTESGKGNKEVYSLIEDAEYIYASFLQDYGIDLIEEQGKLHWYKFRALLVGLRADTKFKEVVNIRMMELPTGKGTGKQREQIKKAKKQYALQGITQSS
ncbi:bacteriophage Gp15 family protein [Halalkalibacter oceani]|uniref:bacteriophage Gp15 family protein n=1 Tax=Halalkalibacter oceani TaxID=1653776 RepID=UPI00339B430E